MFLKKKKQIFLRIFIPGKEMNTKKKKSVNKKLYKVYKS